MAVTTASDIYYDPKDLAIAREPNALFKRMRDNEPLYRNDELDFYALTRYDDVEAALIDKARYLSSHGVTYDLLKMQVEIPPGTLVFEDDPEHAIHRTLLSRMFTTRRVAELDGWVRDLCAVLLDPYVGEGGFDFNHDLAREIPMRVICKLIGYPESEQERIRDRTKPTAEEGADLKQMAAEALTGAIFTEYLDWRIENPSDDVITQLLTAEFDDENGVHRRLTRQETLAYINVVAAAGNDTTQKMIGWMGKTLSDHPEQLKMLAQDRSLIPAAIEEILRFSPSTIQTARYVGEDLEVHGQTVPEGSIMLLLLAAANRDESHFEDPERFDITRTPGRVFSFGWGAHYCLGQALARLELRIVLDEVLKRFPHWEADMDKAEFVSNDAFRGWDSLPVVTR